MKKNTPSERLINGIIKENPTFCADAWYVSNTGHHHIRNQWYRNGTYHNVVILAASNLMISLLRNFIPDSVRMPAFTSLL